MTQLLDDELDMLTLAYANFLLRLVPLSVVSWENGADPSGCL